MVSEMTKAELLEHIEGLEKQIQERQENWDSIVNVIEIDKVTFGRDPQVPGGVLLTAPNGVVVITPEDWIDMVCEASIGGNNGTNQAIVRNLHLG